MSAKRIFLVFACVFFSCFVLAAQSPLCLEIDNDNEFEQVDAYWLANSGMMQRYPGGAVLRSESGRQGGCLLITNTATSRTALYSRTCIPVFRQRDRLHVSLYVKGKGKILFGYYLYDQRKKYIASYFEPAIQVDSSEWSIQHFLSPAEKFAAGTYFIRLAIQVPPGEAELYVDSLSGHLERSWEDAPGSAP